MRRNLVPDTKAWLFLQRTISHIHQDVQENRGMIMRPPINGIVLFAKHIILESSDWRELEGQWDGRVGNFTTFVRL